MPCFCVNFCFIIPFRQRIDEGPLFCFNFVVIRVRRRIEIKLPLVYLTHNTLYENAIERV